MPARSTRSRAAVFGGYREGLAAEGVEIEADVLERAWATHLAIRSVFSALIVDHLPDLDDAARAELVGRRAALARFGLDLALKHAGSGVSSRPMTARGPDHPLIDVRAGRSEPRRRRPGSRTAPPGAATTARPDR